MGQHELSRRRGTTTLCETFVWQQGNMTASKMSESLVSAHCSSFGMLPSGGTCTFVSPAPIALSKSFLYHRKSDHQACRQSSHPLPFSAITPNSIECFQNFLHNLLVIWKPRLSVSMCVQETHPQQATTSKLKKSSILQTADMLRHSSGLHSCSRHSCSEQPLATQNHRLLKKNNAKCSTTQDYLYTHTYIFMCVCVLYIYLYIYSYIRIYLYICALSCIYIIIYLNTYMHM